MLDRLLPAAATCADSLATVKPTLDVQGSIRRRVGLADAWQKLDKAVRGQWQGVFEANPLAVECPSTSRAKCFYSTCLGCFHNAVVTKQPLAGRFILTHSCGRAIAMTASVSKMLWVSFIMPQEKCPCAWMQTLPINACFVTRGPMVRKLSTHFLLLVGLYNAGLRTALQGP